MEDISIPAFPQGKISLRSIQFEFTIFHFPFCILPPGFSQTNTCWPNYRGNSQLTGISTAVLPKSPSLLWSFKADDSFKTSPVICKNTLVIGSTDGNVYGLTLDGNLKWKINTGNGIESPALIVNEIVYVGNLNGVICH
ncbi:MAG: PQQ-like beta-propeller repeat protein [Bacteroidales bacterium]|nr:PQQ-like beta-propeller repeat protein [Bacteroidales bacterium]